MITERERETALALLARSRQTLLDALGGVTDAQARWKPTADRWTVLEYVEHLAVSAGRFGSLDEAVTHFLAARERTIEYASRTQEDLRLHFATHPVLGPLDAYQWLVGNARHVETHAGHIREIRATDGFPAQP
jgi:DinB superfamily